MIHNVLNLVWLKESQWNSPSDQTLPGMDGHLIVQMCRKPHNRATNLEVLLLLVVECNAREEMDDSNDGKIDQG